MNWGWKVRTRLCGNTSEWTGLTKECLDNLENFAVSIIRKELQNKVQRCVNVDWDYDINFYPAMFYFRPISDLEEVIRRYDPVIEGISWKINNTLLNKVEYFRRSDATL